MKFNIDAHANATPAEGFVLRRMESHICYGLLGFLTGSKQKTKQEESQNVTGSKSGTQAVAQTGGSTTTQSGTSSTVASTTEASQREATQQQATSSSGITQKSSLDADTLAKLTSFLSGASGTAAESNARLNALGATAAGGATSFDPSMLADGAIASARQAFDDNVVPKLVEIFAQAGGSEKTNSQSALIASKERRNLEASLAGVRADAMLKGEQLRQSGLTGAADIANAGQGGLIQGVNAISNANQTVQTTQQENVLSQLSELLGRSGTSTSDTNTTQSQQVAEFLNQIMQLDETSEQSGTAEASGSGTSRGSLLGAIGKLASVFAG